MEKPTAPPTLTKERRFGPLDDQLVLSRGPLSAGQRIQAMLNARELAVGFMRGRLYSKYPHLSPRELNLKLLEEIELVNSIRPRPKSLS